MHRVDHRSARFGGTRGEPCRRHPRRSGRAISLLAAAVAPFIPSAGNAQTWVNPNTGSWSVSANWVGGVVPVSGSATQLRFRALAAETFTASNDIAIPFTLNSITLENTGNGLITIAQNALSFGGASPAINQISTGSARIDNALQLTTNTSLIGGGDGTVTLAGAVTSVPNATGTTGASLINNGNDARLVLLGGTTGGNLYGLRLSTGSTFIQSGACTLTSTQRGSDPFDGINDGGFWSFIVGNTAAQTARFTMTGGTVTGQNAMIGNALNGDGIATFSGVGTSATFTGAQGRFGTNLGDGTINILGGATVSARRGDLIRNPGGSGFMQVDGTGSRFTATQELNLPLSSGNATLTVSAGGLVDLPNANFYVASAIDPAFNAVSSNASATVSGANSRINLTGATSSMVVGFGGVGVTANGTVSISSAGVVNAPGTFIGRGLGTGTVTVSGAGSQLNNSFQLVVGSTTASSLNVTNGATWTAPVGFGFDAFASTNATDRSIINISGTNSLGAIPGALVLSGDGSSTLNISGGGELRALTLFASDAPSGVSNTFVSGTNSKLTINDQAFISDAAGSLANITVSAGANLNVSSAMFLSSPVGAVSNVTITGPGSSFTSTQTFTQLQIGGNGGIAGGTASFSVTDGATATVNGPTVVYTRGNLNIGTGALPGSFVAPTNSVNGTVNFNSGTFNTTGTLSVGGQVLLSSAARNISGTPTNKKVLEAGTLSLTASGVVDLNDNDAILHNTPLLTVQNKIRDARNGGAWNAPGITSTAAKNASPQNTSLGTIRGADFHSANGGAGALFNGRTVAINDTLVKYTYYGDTDLNGSVNFDDYARTDGGFNNNRTGWFNGDFDYSGDVDFDDYAVIDLAFNTQGGVVLAIGDGNFAGPGERTIIGVQMPRGLASAPGIAPDMIDPVLRGHPLQAVPEPSLLGAASLSLFAVASRRRRRTYGN